MYPEEIDRDSEHRWEWVVFLFLTVFLAPLLAVTSILGFGLLVWLWQYCAGAPGVG